MTLPVKQPNYELAIVLLADGHDAKLLRKHCGFPSHRAARDFMSASDTRSEVRELVRERAARLGMKSLRRLEELVDDENTEARVAVAAARTGLEVGGLLHKDAALPVKNVSELSVAELDELISQTKRELEAARRKQPIN